MRSILFFTLLILAPMLQASDFVREKQWEDEILDSLVVGEAVYLNAGKHRFLGLYTPASRARGSVILVHGTGVHPDWGLIGVQRRRLADAGYTTLAIQMPVLPYTAKAGAYARTFGDAATRLRSAVNYLKGKGQDRVAIVSHSLGSRMTNYYLTQSADAAVVVWVALGLPGAFEQADKLHLPVIDMFGDADLPAVLEKRTLRKQTIDHLPGAQQIVIPHADHFFTGRDDELFNALHDVLDGFFYVARLA